MITIDFECSSGHRFEGVFGDYESFQTQSNQRMIACPLCGTVDVKRIYTGCSIQAKSSDSTSISKDSPNLFDLIRLFNTFVRQNFEYVGKDFPEIARAIHWGIEKERSIYGESTLEEVRELREEGIEVVPLIDVDGIEH